MEDIDVPVGMFIWERDLYNNPRNSYALAEALGDNLVFFNTYDFSHYGVYVAQNIVEYLSDLVSLVEAYPPARDE